MHKIKGMFLCPIIGFVTHNDKSTFDLAKITLSFHPAGKPYRKEEKLKD